MSLFKPADNSMAYLKLGVMGEAGSGKTHTASLIMIGLVKFLRERKISGADRPVFLLDTEQGSAWIRPMFEDAGITLHVAKTRAFKDLVPALREAERTSSGLMIDSISHFWTDLQESHMARRDRTRLEFQDWAVLKKLWRQFSDVFVNSELHCILCGRLGFEYEQYEDERGKRQIEKSGVKMQAEKGLGYEPNMLVWMERDLDLSTKVMTRTATILKDRSQRLDGRQFPNPTFETFLPHIEFLALGGKHEGIDTSRNSEDIIPDDDAPSSDIKSIRRAIVVEEIQALMLKHYPSRNAEDVKAKGALLTKYFSTTSWTEVEKLMPLVDLQSNYNNMHCDLEGVPSRYGVQVAPVPTDPVDEIPYLEPDNESDAEQPQKAEAQAKEPDIEPDDLDIIVHDFVTAIGAAKTADERKRLWDESAEIREAMDEPRLERMRRAYAKATMSPKGKPGRGKQTLQAAE